MHCSARRSRSPTGCRRPTRCHWLLLGSLGILGGVGHYLFIHAYRLAPASAIAPFLYLQLLTMVAFGYRRVRRSAGCLDARGLSRDRRVRRLPLPSRARDERLSARKMSARPTWLFHNCNLRVLIAITHAQIFSTLIPIKFLFLQHLANILGYSRHWGGCAICATSTIIHNLKWNFGLAPSSRKGQKRGAQLTFY